MYKIELFDKQAQFYNSNNRINVYCGGIQSGKTTCGGVLMFMDNMRYRGEDDNFIVAADTYKTLSQATIPKFMKLAGPHGKMNYSAGHFKYHWGSTVFFRTATDPESMEGISNVRRIWVDEGGKTSKYFFENCMGRAAFKMAPIDITTTPYALNWLYQLNKDWKAGKASDCNFVVCRSIDSPYFPKEEYERQKKKLDPRRFAMKYEGEFGKMEGLVYDKINLCRSFALPLGTKYYAGIDWGYYPDPFCLVIRAVTPEKRQYRVDEYYKNYLTASDIVNVVKSYNSIYKFDLVVCDPSQPAHIEELNRNGIRATGADNNIRMGIDRHYELIRAEEFWIFEDRNPIGLDEYNTYHYPEERELKIDQSRSEREQIPVDSNNHGVDADRYLTITLSLGRLEHHVIKNPDAPKNPFDSWDLMKRSEKIRKRSIEYTG